ncbi:uncharacterized protein [Musca autumnalis]|uniref:uncharacterized protein n=1 Tax=Musca autumnalis TaxID=221902 RepID=UPI003CF92DC4
MRAFIVLCLVATACAQYNYQVGGDSGVSSGSFNSGAASNTASFGVSSVGGASISSGISGGNSFSVSSNAGPAVGSSSTFGVSSGSSSYAPTSSGPAFTGASEGSFGSASSIAPAQAELEKEFYTFTANEEDFAEPAASNQFNNVAKQGLRVIFIKGPENNGLEDAVLGLAKSASEQQTAIYVLNKQADLSALAEKLNAENTDVNHKPEVHFVKYRTPEDAANAQRTIQAQYDALGGKSEHINGGVATSLNFASAAPAVGTAGQQSGSFQVATGGQQSGSFLAATGGQQSGSFLAATGGQQGGSFQAATSATYLPASVLRRFRH